MVICIGELPFNTMYYHLAGCVGFNSKGFFAEPMGFHYIRVVPLNGFYHSIHLCVNLGLGLAVARKEVDEPHDVPGVLSKTQWQETAQDN